MDNNNKLQAFTTVIQLLEEGSYQPKHFDAVKLTLSVLKELSSKLAAPTPNDPNTIERRVPRYTQEPM